MTATATPVSVTWHPGDGSTVTCQGAGTSYANVDNPAAAWPDCGHNYTSSSAGQPGGAFQATATITWDITWRGAGGAGGALPPLFTTAVAAFLVADSQALNASGDLTPPGHQRSLPAGQEPRPRARRRCPRVL